jgi:hypothetical protein
VRELLCGAAASDRLERAQGEQCLAARSSRRIDQAQAYLAGAPPHDVAFENIAALGFEEEDAAWHEAGLGGPDAGAGFRNVHNNARVVAQAIERQEPAFQARGKARVGALIVDHVRLSLAQIAAGRAQPGSRPQKRAGMAARFLDRPTSAQPSRH